MLGDAVKRLEYVLRQRPEEALTDASSAPTPAYWVLFDTTQIMLAAIGADALAHELDNRVRHPVDLLQVLREHGIGNTPYDKLIPWTYNVVRTEYDARAKGDKLDELQARATEIMQWQAATRTDINKLSIDQVFAAVTEWAAPRAEEIVYEFPNGWTVKNLIGPASLVREGELLHHCVKEPQYAAAVAAGDKVIYSLRDPSNKPHVTMEWLPHDKRFRQMMMRDNKHPPSAEYRPMLIEFVTWAHGGNLRDLLLTGVSARDLDLRSMDLRKADLAGVILSSVVLSGADLTGADLTGAKLIGADLTNANLTNAHLAYAALTGAGLNRADLSGANLYHGDLGAARLIAATLLSANLFGANLAHTDLSAAVLTHADLSYANLRGANLKGAKLTNADLTRATLRKADLSGADLTATMLVYADLTDAIFDEETIMPDGTNWSPPAGLGYYRRGRW